MLWIYNLDNWLMCLLIVATFVSASVGGLKLVRPWVKTHCYEAFQDHNEAVSAFIGTYGVFFGITLGLIAVATWENYEAASDVVDQEAASLAALYRDVSGFPEPARTVLRALTKVPGLRGGRRVARTPPRHHPARRPEARHGV